MVVALKKDVSKNNGVRFCFNVGNISCTNVLPCPQRQHKDNVMKGKFMGSIMLHVTKKQLGSII